MRQKLVIAQCEVFTHARGGKVPPVCRWGIFVAPLTIFGVLVGVLGAGVVNSLVGLGGYWTTVQGPPLFALS